MSREPWQDWEAEVARDLNLSLTICSGNKAHDPGDAVSRGRGHGWPLYADCKTTVRGSYSLKATELAQHVERAADLGKRFVLPLRFVGVADYAVVTYNDFQELYDRF